MDMDMDLTDNSGNNNDTNCVICMLEMTKSSEVEMLPCGHSFHDHCIRQWLYFQLNNVNVATCPLCRNKLSRVL